VGSAVEKNKEEAQLLVRQEKNMSSKKEKEGQL